MEYLISKYNEYIEKVAPEIGEEVVFSPRMQKYILVKHYEEGVVDACTIENAEQLATELMLSIGFHVGNSSEFKVFSKLQQREKLREEVLIQKRIIL